MQEHVGMRLPETKGVSNPIPVTLNTSGIVGQPILQPVNEQTSPFKHTFLTP